MMAAFVETYADTLAWLLEPDDPAVRYLALRDLLDRPPDDAELLAARCAAHQGGPIPAILNAMHAEGYWERPGAGYTPKYRGTVWSLITLALCGASVEEDARIGQACAYLLDHAFTPDGRFGIEGTPGSNVDCLHGNLCAALLDLGYDDPRLNDAFTWAARSVTGEGVAPKGTPGAALSYDRYNVGSGFACRANADLPCAWGAVKLLWGFGLWPEARRTPLVERAIAQTVDFLLSIDPATAAYPPAGAGEPPSKRWWQFGFPIFYPADLLQLVEGLVSVGYGRDPRLAGALDVIRGKQDESGRWPLEYRYYGKDSWWNFGRRGSPNKWITLRALRVLKAAG